MKMNIQTQYTYEKIWTLTQEKDLLKIIAQEVGDADPQGTLAYVKESIKGGKTITVGSCRFRKGQ
jgi:chromosome condensin MukBEF MukE localization factor